jgi:hypothetical protein
MDADEVIKAAESFLDAHDNLMKTQNSYGLFLKGNTLRKALLR